MEDVFPNQPYGFHILKTPNFLKRIFDPAPIPYVDIDERPGGYNWYCKFNFLNIWIMNNYRGAEQPIQQDESSDEDDVVLIQ